MAGVADRHHAAVALIDPGPDDRVLEIGCGPGVTAGLVLARLTGAGRLTAVDRSAKMVAQAIARNAEAVAAGRLDVVHAEVGAPAAPGGPYDIVYALNVAALWRQGDPALAAARSALGPAGRLVLLMQGPGEDGPGRVSVWEARAGS